MGFGDEVVVPSYATAGAAEAVRSTGARPVFADIDPWSLCLDPAAVLRALSERTAAIVPVGLFGYPADLAALQALASPRELAVIEHTEDIEQAPADADAVHRRRQHAAYLDARLTGVITPRVPTGVAHSYHSYVVRVPGNGRPDRDAFARALRARGVRCRVPVQTPVHRTPAYRCELRLPETERAADDCLALPVEEGMSRRELRRMVSLCNGLGGLLPVAA